MVAESDKRIKPGPMPQGMNPSALRCGLRLIVVLIVDAATFARQHNYGADDQEHD